MRNHILDRLAFLADAIINTSSTSRRQILAEAAHEIAVTYHPTIPPSEGSP